MPPTRERGKYSKDLLHTAVQAVINGSKAPEVAKRHNIPIATLNKRVREQRSGQALVTKRRGPKPTLPDSCEEDLVAWIVAMQRDGNPTDRKTIIVKANQVLRRLDPTASLSAGWYRRLIVRHPQLTNRVAQVISSARNEVDDVAVTTLFNSLVNAIVTNKLSSDRVFNMDETSFASRRKSKDVIALKEKNIENYCSVPNATISTSPKGFMNEDLFENWLKYFAKTDGGVPKTTLLAPWIERREVIRREVLCLPAKEKKKRGSRSTVDVAGRILTLGLLHEVDTTRKERLEATKQKKALQTKRAKKKPRREVKSCACGDHVVAKPQSTTGHAATELESVVVI
ncbi:hypothetical protein DYB25_005772 [Aphanomyces astaci]|uniref:HTH CENPB-type domain-containing protein n=1 Tax=Aphanomyces astaci TaxID=112090 RepID=A0A397A027_APHAT|nr:hypothetical protein DYB25_005772 [Aphanomyces astaci]